MKILVHLGVHKTATTFIQSQLANNRAELARKGFGVAGIWAVRKRFTNLFDRLAWFDPVWRFLTRPILKRRLEKLMRDTGNVETFLLSDENIIGTIGLNYWTGKLYSWAAARLKIIKALLAGHDVHYYLCIRRYPDYLISSWLQMASKGNAPPFDRYLDKFTPKDRGWTELVENIAAVVGKENLTVWTYDWFAEDPTRVFALLTPDIEFEVEESELKREILPSLTIKGLNVISQLEEHLSRAELKRLSAIIRTFPFDEPNPRLEISDPAMLTAFEEKYQRDLVAIRALGIELHAP